MPKPKIEPSMLAPQSPAALIQICCIVKWFRCFVRLPTALLVFLSPSEEFEHARLAELFEAFGRLRYGALAFGVAFRIKLIGVANHLFLRRFGQEVYGGQR